MKTTSSIMKLRSWTICPTYQKDLCRQTAAGQPRITQWKMTPQSKRSGLCKSSAANSTLRSVPATHMASSWPGDHLLSTSTMKIWTVIIPKIYIHYQTAGKVREIKNKWLNKWSKINLIEFSGRGLVSSVRASLSSRTSPARFLSRQLLLQVLVQA